MPGIEELVKITLDKERHLKLTLKGMLEFQKATDINLVENPNLDNLSMEDTGALVWACLIHEDRELTLEDVLYMIDLSNITSVIEAVGECFERALKKQEGEEAAPLGKKPRAG